jgi:hypothetical protein
MKKAFLGLASIIAASLTTPAFAAVYTYTLTNNDVLTVNTSANSGTLIGSQINAAFTGGLSAFTGGPTPSYMALLDTLTGTRVINGVSLSVSPPNLNHPQKLIFSGTSINLWSYWGNPVQGGDYVVGIKGYTPPAPVPEPAMMGLFALASGGLLFARSRRKKIAA